MTTLDRAPLSTEPPRQLSQAELAARHAQAFPEAAGPATDHESGEARYGVNDAALARIGAIPHLLDPETVARENRERAERLAAMSPEQRAAMDTVADLVAAELRRR